MPFETKVGLRYTPVEVAKMLKDCIDLAPIEECWFYGTYGNNGNSVFSSAEIDAIQEHILKARERANTI